MGRLVLGSVLAGVVLMIWGFVAWPILGDRMGIVVGAPDEAALMDGVRAGVIEEGTYFFPTEGARGDATEQAAWRERHEQGPVGLLFVRPAGLASNMGAVMGAGLVHFVVSAFLVGLLLQRAGLASYGARVGFVTLAGVFAAVAIHVSPSIWWYVPWSYSIFAVVTSVVGWWLAGLVLARFVTPARG